jgi:hypothetical protein
MMERALLVLSPPKLFPHLAPRPARCPAAHAGGAGRSARLSSDGARERSVAADVVAADFIQGAHCDARALPFREDYIRRARHASASSFGATVRWQYGWSSTKPTKYSAATMRGSFR